MKNAEKGKFDQIYLLIERYLCPVKPSEYRPSRRFYAGTKDKIGIFRLWDFKITGIKYRFSQTDKNWEPVSSVRAAPDGKFIKGVSVSTSAPSFRHTALAFT